MRALVIEEGLTPQRPVFERQSFSSPSKPPIGWVLRELRRRKYECGPKKQAATTARAASPAVVLTRASQLEARPPPHSTSRECSSAALGVMRRLAGVRRSSWNRVASGGFKRRARRRRWGCVVLLRRPWSSSAEKKPPQAATGESSARRTLAQRRVVCHSRSIPGLPLQRSTWPQSSSAPTCIESFGSAMNGIDSNRHRILFVFPKNIHKSRASCIFFGS
jgi:hypothetical protein